MKEHAGKVVHLAGRIVNALLIVLCVLLCLLVIVNVAVQKHGSGKLPMFLGWGHALVQTGSMEPEIHAGALILVHRQDSYAVGDIVCYQDNRGNVVTHRLVALADGFMEAQGDANNTADELVPTDRIYGRVVVSSLAAGRTVIWIKSNITSVLLAAVILITGIYVGKKIFRMNTGNKRECGENPENAQKGGGD